MKDYQNVNKKLASEIQMRNSADELLKDLRQQLRNKDEIVK